MAAHRVVRNLFTPQHVCDWWDFHHAPSFGDGLRVVGFDSSPADLAPTAAELEADARRQMVTVQCGGNTMRLPLGDVVRHDQIVGGVA